MQLQYICLITRCCIYVYAQGATGPPGSQGEKGEQGEPVVGPKGFKVCTNSHHYVFFYIGLYMT